MLGRLVTARPFPALIALTLLVAGCLPVADNAEGRNQVVDLARAGELEPVKDHRSDWMFRVPPGLDVSEGGEVVVHRDGVDLVVVFFDFRGLNHYTGWVYTSADALAEDPLSNHPFKADRIAPNWFRVDAG